MKAKEMMKAIGVTTLAIGLLATGLMAVNRGVMAHAINGGEPMHFSVVQPGAEVPLPHVEAAEAEAENAYVPDQFVEPSITVGRGHIPSERDLNAIDTATMLQLQSNTPSENAIDVYEAAMVGARYIWDMFGESIDGMHITLWYTAWPSHTRSYWTGTVSDTYEDSMGNQTRFHFVIDAITGERIDIGRVAVMDESVGAALREGRRSADGTGDSISDEILRLRLAHYYVPEDIDFLTQRVKEIAAIHFTNTLVESALFRGLNADAGTIGFDENGNLTVLSYVANFTVTDSTGRTAFITFHTDTGELAHLSTQHNDVIPGFFIGNEFVPSDRTPVDDGTQGRRNPDGTIG